MRRLLKQENSLDGVLLHLRFHKKFMMDGITILKVLKLKMNGMKGLKLIELHFLKKQMILQHFLKWTRFS